MRGHQLLRRILRPDRSELRLRLRGRRLRAVFLWGGAAGLRSPRILCAAVAIGLASLDARGYSSWMRTISLSLLAAALLLPAACEDTTAKVVGTAVKAAKDTPQGDERGIEDGRKAAASADEAIIVTKPDDLTGHGTIQVGTVTPSEWGCDVELVVENASDRPLRISSPDITAID